MVAEGERELGETHGTADHRGEHCPFLNRSDRRCSNCLSLDRLDHAFDYCFGEYKACPVYLEMLAERRVRRLCGLLTLPEQKCPGDLRSDFPDASRTSRRPTLHLPVAA